MNVRNLSGGIGLVLMCGLIGFSIWLTKDTGGLWAIFLVAVFGTTFPWEKETKG